MDNRKSSSKHGVEGMFAFIVTHCRDRSCGYVVENHDTLQNEFGRVSFGSVYFNVAVPSTISHCHCQPGLALCAHTNAHMY